MVKLNYRFRIKKDNVFELDEEWGNITVYTSDNQTIEHILPVSSPAK